MSEIDARAQEYLDEQYPNLAPEYREMAARHFMAGYRAHIHDIKPKVDIPPIQKWAKLFLDDQTMSTRSEFAKLGVVHKRYLVWCNDRKYKELLTIRGFAAFLRALGHEIRHTSKAKGWVVVGMALATTGWENRFSLDCLVGGDSHDTVTGKEAYACYLAWAKKNRIRMPVELPELLMVVRREGYIPKTSVEGATFIHLKLKWPAPSIPMAEVRTKAANDKELLAEFIQTCVKPGPNSVMSMDVYDAYVLWATTCGVKADLSIAMVSRAVQEHGFEKVHTRKGNAFLCTSIQTLPEAAK